MIYLWLTKLKLGWVRCQFLFRERSSSFYFSRKLLKFWAYTNSLYHSYCSQGALVVFYNNFFISGSKFLSHQWRQWLELALVLILLTIWISYCFSLAHKVEIWMNLLSVSFRDESASSYFWGSCSRFELVQILLIICIAVVFVLVFTMGHWQCFVSGRKILPDNKGSCWNSWL